MAFAQWSEKILKRYSNVFGISSEDVITYFSNEMVNFGLRRQFEGIRIDSGAKEDEVIMIDPINLNECDFSRNRVIKIDSPSKDFPVEKFSNKMTKAWEQPDYYKESLHKLLKDHGY